MALGIVVMACGGASGAAGQGERLTSCRQALLVEENPPMSSEVLGLGPRRLGQQKREQRVKNKHISTCVSHPLGSTG